MTIATYVPSSREELSGAITAMIDAYAARVLRDAADDFEVTAALGSSVIRRLRERADALEPSRADA